MLSCSQPLNHSCSILCTKKEFCDNFETEFCYWCCLLAVNGDVTSCKAILKDNDIICNKVHRFELHSLVLIWWFNATLWWWCHSDNINHFSYFSCPNVWTFIRIHCKLMEIKASYVFFSCFAKKCMLGWKGLLGFCLFFVWKENQKSMTSLKLPFKHEWNSSLFQQINEGCF